MALRAKLYFEREIIFEISLREISKIISLSKECSAAEGGKRLFTQPRPLNCPNLQLEDS